MPTTKARLTTNQKGLGRRHQLAREALLRKHVDGTKCSWCGLPMYRDRTKNHDYKPDSTNPNSGELHAHHGAMSRAECVRRGLPIPLPDELLHGSCNIQLGDGVNKHLAASNRTHQVDTDTLLLAWPW